MPTIILNKKQFVEYVEGLIDDGESVLLTTEVGSMEYTKKSYKVLYHYAPDAFDKNTGIGELSRGKNISFCITKTEKLKHETKNS